MSIISSELGVTTPTVAGTAYDSSSGFLNTGRFRTIMTLSAAEISTIASDLGIDAGDINSIFMIFQHPTEEEVIESLKFSKFGADSDFIGQIDGHYDDEVDVEYEELLRVIYEDNGTTHIQYNGVNLVAPEKFMFLQADINGDVDIGSLLVFAQKAIIVASDGASNDQFGIGVDIDGDLLSVGAYNKDGTTGEAYVYKTIDGGDSWSEFKITQATGLRAFGYSTAISGDKLIVGAPFDAGFAGALYCYDTSDGGSTWGNEQIITSGGSGQLGINTAIDGNRMVAVGGSKAYVYTYSGGTWGNEKIIDIGNELIGVDIEGDRIALGSSQIEQAFVYKTTDGGASWVSEQTLLPSNAGSDQYGCSISMSGSIIVVGAYNEADSGDTLVAGAAYVFTRSGVTWTEQQILRASDRQLNDQFGFNLSISGTTIVVGAQQEDGGVGDPITGAGALYTYKTSDSGATWTEDLEILRASDAFGGDRIGAFVKIDNNRIAAASANRNDSAGAVYIFS